MAELEFRHRTCDELKIRPARFDRIEESRAIKRQSKPPNGGMTVAECQRPRLGRVIWARSSTIASTRSASLSDGVAPGVCLARNRMYQDVSSLQHHRADFFTFARGAW